MKLDDDKVIFFSSSGGGYASIYASSLLKNSLSISINPQLIIKNHGLYENFKKITGFDLKIKDVLHRNDLFAHISNNNSSTHVILINLQSADFNKQLCPFLNLNNIELTLRYGLNRYKNLFIWIYDSAGVPNAHTSFETKPIYAAIDYISKQLRSTKNIAGYNYNKLQKYVILVNEIWRDLYEEKKLNYNLINNSIDLKIINKNIFKFTLSQDNNKICYKNIKILANNSDYNYHKLDGFFNNKIYNIKLYNAISSSKSFYIGFYDSFNKMMIKTIVFENGNAEFFFFIEKNAENLWLCFYPNEPGKTAGYSLVIDSLKINVQ